MSPPALAPLLLACLARGEGPATVRYLGACDASGAVLLPGDRILVADDEDNHLRLYDRARGGAPLAVSRDLAAALDLPPGDAGERELDLEGGTRLGSAAAWIGSHGASRRGRSRPARRTLLLTDPPASAHLALPPVRDLLPRLGELPLGGMDLAAAARRPPKAPGGLAIEALASTPDGTLWIGFRAPLVPEDGRALLVAVPEPERLLRGERATLRAHGLDLEGLGIRALEADADGALVGIAGPPGRGSRFRAFRWQPSTGSLRTWEAGLPADFTPESLVRLPGGGFWAISDDGRREVEGRPCRELPPAARFARGAPLPPAPPD